MPGKRSGLAEQHSYGVKTAQKELDMVNASLVTWRRKRGKRLREQAWASLAEIAGLLDSSADVQALDQAVVKASELIALADQIKFKEYARTDTNKLEKTLYSLQQRAAD